MRSNQNNSYQRSSWRLAAIKDPAAATSEENEIKQFFLTIFFIGHESATADEVEKQETPR